MRKLVWGYSHSPAAEFIGGMEQTQGTETSKYLEEKKETSIPSVAASETGPSPNRAPCGRGVVGPTDGRTDGRGSRLERRTREGESPVCDRIRSPLRGVPE